MGMRTLAIAILASAGLALTGPAAAATISHFYSGTLTLVSDPSSLLPPGITVGSSFTGSFTYDTSVLDSNASSLFGQYDHAPGTGDLALTLGPLSLVRGNTSNIRFQTEDYAASDDYFNVMGLDDTILSGIASDDHAFLMVLSDPTDQALPSDALPPSGISLSDYGGSNPEFTLSIVSGQDAAVVFGKLSSVEVPEPGAGLLLAAGFLALAFARR